MVNYSDDFIEARGIKAETWISLLDVYENLSIQTEGVFVRNYSEDLLKLEKDGEQTIATLSRDGVFHLLPQGLFFRENQLRVRAIDFEQALEELKKQKKEALAFFKPFDTTYFNLNLQLEQKLNDFAEIGNDILTNYFLSQYKEEEKNNKYISKIKILLPFVSQIRGDVLLLVDVLKGTLSVEKVEVEEIELFHQRFIIHKEGMNAEEYRAMDKEMESFFDFFRHWFLPIEQKYDYRIKDYKPPFTLGTELILDYNTHL